MAGIAAIRVGRLDGFLKTSELESQARQVGVRAVIAKEEGVIKLLRVIEEELAPPLV